MPIVYRQEFEVEGSGDFPFDMLRYDNCWPVREGTDTGNMAITYGRPFPMRRIKLARYVFSKSDYPTEGRWKSFLWRVIPESIKTEKL